MTNYEILPEDHLTKMFILNTTEGSRSAPTRNQHLQESVLGSK